MVEEIQKKLSNELEKYKAAQKEYQKVITQRQQLDGQLNENKVVMAELKILKADSEVYKLMGPVLIKQDLEESRQNVAKRIEYIEKELTRMNGVITDLDKKQDKHRDALQKLQHQFQQAQVKAAMKA
uniref:Probable prefoldin subunit 6 n=1 Tax=Xenopsylla cheopis TaxID=163159 RepID=A0A6M2DMM7_XENCH